MRDSSWGRAKEKGLLTRLPDWVWEVEKWSTLEPVTVEVCAEKSTKRGGEKSEERGEGRKKGGGDNATHDQLDFLESIGENLPVGLLTGKGREMQSGPEEGVERRERAHFLRRVFDGFDGRFVSDADDGETGGERLERVWWRW